MFKKLVSDPYTLYLILVKKFSKMKEKIQKMAVQLVSNYTARRGNYQP